VTGRSLKLIDHSWLDGPIGGTRQIGKRFFEDYAAVNQLEIITGGSCGLLPDFRLLEAGNRGLAGVAQPVRDFYERTSEFDLDVWSEWRGFFRPFGKALSVIFSRRLQQLNVPLSSMDTSRGMTSRVVQLRDPKSGRVIHTAWVRELNATQNVIYAGCYAVCRIPGHPSPCVKVVFPLPNGYAIVLMKAESDADGSLSLQSRGNNFGEPGFYFVVHEGNGMIRARYVRSMQEEIRVYTAEPGIVRADHTLWIWGRRFLRLHYRMRKQQAD
jgi:hypothetical protein